LSVVRDYEGLYDRGSLAATGRVPGGKTVIGTTLNGRFALDRELGRGGMGAVYRASDQILQRTVAIKVLKDLSGDEVGKRLRLEAQILARLLHDNIVRLYDFNEDGGTYYFIMEEVDGTSFQKRWRKISLPDRMRILAQVADALDYAHHQGVIHRDIKPANVLLTSSDQAKLSDFGLSMLSDMAQETGVVRGTPHYMSPEQAKGRRLDHRTDLYALGVILYECATGAPPFTGALMTIMAQHVNAQPEPPRTKAPEITEELEALILELLSKAPDARPGSGREVADRLRDLIARGRIVGESQPAQTGNGAAPPSSGSLAARTSAGMSLGQGTPSGSGTLLSAGPGPAASASIAGPPLKTFGGDSTSARPLINAVDAEPIILTPDERYLAGHYLAYLLGGSRRRGFLRRRPLDPLNADRARLLLAMTYLSIVGANDETLARASAVLERRPDVRAALSPVVVLKYLAARDTPGKRKRFRQIRQQLQQASPYADKHLVDDRGVLNPGLMPQVLDDLKRIAPEKTEVDDQLVQRWNRVTEVWRGNPEFREAVLRYATKGAWRDPASGLLWPEVVYPLIERARWQRQLRSAPEALLDAICAPLHLPDAGLRLDRAFRVAVPQPVAEKLDVSLHAFVEDPVLDEDPAAEAGPESRRVSMSSGIRAESFSDLEVEQHDRGLVRLNVPDPVRHTLGELRTLWQEGIAALRNPQAKAARTLPVGPYRLTVVASIRSRAAGQIAIQGMPNKQIEMLIPSFTGGGSNSKPVLAVYVYTNGSLAITYLDHMNAQRFIFWDTSTNQQTNFEDAADLNHTLYQVGLEAPDGLDRALSKGFRPRNPV
jgi:predicted Ser/Thr protein kinase